VPGRHQWNHEPKIQVAATSWKRQDIQRDLHEDFQAGDRKVNSRIFCQTSKNYGLAIVEGSAPSKTEKEIAHRVRAVNVGAPATLGSFALTVWRKGSSRSGWREVTTGKKLSQRTMKPSTALRKEMAVWL
jgi:hypothetical protein